jgi:hypothetical protein
MPPPCRAGAEEEHAQPLRHASPEPETCTRPPRRATPQAQEPPVVRVETEALRKSASAPPRHYLPLPCASFRR